MSERVATLEEAAAAFETFAAAEGARIPVYARLCRTIAADPGLHGLLLSAPTGQRLPVLLLAALHDVVLRHPELPLARWYPSVRGTAAPDDDPGPALRAAVHRHRREILRLLQDRQVQTNEVNRCAAWWYALCALPRTDSRPLYLVELGASAGLNLRPDRYHYEFSSGGSPVQERGEPDSTVRLGAELRLPAGTTPPPLELSAAVRGAIGLDRRPVDVTDTDDARWLEACVWPEQPQRLDRLRAALALARVDPPQVVRGDVVDDLAPLLDGAPSDAHVVVLSSWVLAYLPRARRLDVLDVLRRAARATPGRGPTLITLEAETVLPWVDAPSLPAEADADERFSSVLATTEFDDSGEPVTRVLARCQAHAVWIAPVAPYNSVG